VATKVRLAGSNEVGLSRKHILAGVEASLRRLRTDYIDLYQVHNWDTGTPLAETLGALDGLARSGKFRRGMQGPPADSRIAVADQYGWSESWSRYNTESTWALLDTLLAVAEDAGRTPARVAINWLLQRPLVTAPIIGVRSMEQLEATLAASGWTRPATQGIPTHTKTSPACISGAEARASG
jgi:aryl-alcohol dehydrogenase-like predicted oxidoreductase